VGYPQQRALFWTRMLTFSTGFLMLTTLGSAKEFDIIGGSEQQKRLVSCVAEAAMPLFRDLPNRPKTMTFVILEHNNFMRSRADFHAYRTELAYSNLAMRRIYLSSRVLANRDTALWVVGHELGHFMIPDRIEDHAEFAAELVRWRARQTCGAIP
jgi:hypothetical protein